MLGKWRLSGLLLGLPKALVDAPCSCRPWNEKSSGFICGNHLFHLRVQEGERWKDMYRKQFNEKKNVLKKSGLVYYLFLWKKMVGPIVVK